MAETSVIGIGKAPLQTQVVRLVGFPTEVALALGVVGEASTMPLMPVASVVDVVVMSQVTGRSETSGIGIERGRSRPHYQLDHLQGALSAQVIGQSVVMMGLGPTDGTHHLGLKEDLMQAQDLLDANSSKDQSSNELNERQQLLNRTANGEPR